MPSLIDEHQVFLDSSGTPIVSGKIYIGSQNNDPVTNPITIYSDRDLTTALPNPQPTDVNGRALNKIWVPAKYSIRVDDADDVQQYQNLDAGDTSETGITNLTNVAGTDTITAEGTPAILALVDNQQYNFRAAAANTGPVTLQIDLTAAKSILKQHDVALAAGDIEANQTVSVIYNATDDAFELVSNVALGNAVNFDVSNDLTVGNDATITGTLTATTFANVPFPATQVPSADANTLDDYEEKDEVITLSPATGSITLQTGANTLAFTKVGRLVNCHGRLIVDSVSTPVGTVSFQLPYAPANLTDGAGECWTPVLITGAVTAANGFSFLCRVQETTTTALIQYADYTAGPTSAEFQASMELMFNFTYSAGS
jgi:hypothetical protein